MSDINSRRMAYRNAARANFYANGGWEGTQQQPQQDDTTNDVQSPDLSSQNTSEEGKRGKQNEADAQSD